MKLLGVETETSLIAAEEKKKKKTLQ